MLKGRLFNGKLFNERLLVGQWMQSASWKIAWSLIAIGNLALPATAQTPPAEPDYAALEQQFDDLQDALQHNLGDLQDWQELNDSLQELNQSMEDYESATEAANPGITARFESYLANLATCSPGTFVDVPFAGATETIRGWEGERCRVNSLMLVGGQSQSHTCLYTPRDLELMTGPELYLPDDLAGQCQRVK